MSEQLFLIAHIAGRGVAIDSAQVESVVDIGAVVPTPRAAPLPSGIGLDAGWRQAGCGAVERDGEPILAIDLTALVHGPSNDPD